MTILSILGLFFIFALTLSISNLQRKNYYDMDNRRGSLIFCLKTLLIISSVYWIYFTSHDILHNQLYKKSTIQLITKQVNI